MATKNLRLEVIKAIEPKVKGYMESLMIPVE
jgi:hypothetical protein